MFSKRWRRWQERMGTTGLMLTLGLAALPARGAAPARAREPFKVRILYDFSGSMYPGYSGTSSKGPSVLFYHEYPEFKSWLERFVPAQRRLPAASVELSRFRELAIEPVQAPATPERFDVARALRRIGDTGWGRNTYLTDIARQAASGFDGVIWMITDNYLDTPSERDVTAFFRQLNDDTRCRSIHLYRLPIQGGTLAVYGLLVASVAPSNADLEEYDRRFASLSELFPGGQHLKLKDLRVGAIVVEPLDVAVGPGPVRHAQEGQAVKASLRGQLRSKLTHHTITGGECVVIADGRFEPDARARRDFGVGAIDGRVFPAAKLPLKAIPPLGTDRFEKSLDSARDLSLPVTGLLHKVKVAALGLRVRYTGAAEVVCRINVRFEPARMQGLFGMDKVDAVFALQRTDTIKPVNRRVNVQFTIDASSWRSLKLFGVLALLLLPLGFAAALFVRTERYRVGLGASEQIVSLRRLGRHAVSHAATPVGTLRRGLAGGFSFVPNTRIAGLRVTALSQPGQYDVELRGSPTLRLSIEPVRDGNTTPARRPGRAQQPPRRDPAPAPSPPGPAAGPRPRPAIVKHRANRT